MGERDALDVLFDGWKGYQRTLAEAIEPLEDSQLTLRVAPHLRSAGELLEHIVATRAGWFHNHLRMGGDEWRAVADWDEPGSARRSAAELKSALDASWRLVADSVGRWTPDDLVATVDSVRRNGERRRLVRGWVVWHVLEHDIHHGGELGFLLGMHGLRAPDL